MAPTYSIHKYEYRAFTISVVIHALLLLVIYFVARRSLSAPLEVKIVVETERAEPEKLQIPKEELHTQPKQKKRRAHPIREKAQAKSKQQAQRDTRTLNDPWSNYEQRMFAQHRTRSGADRGSRTAEAARWGSETTGRTEKRGESEAVNIPTGRSDASTRWRKGTARRLLSLPPIDYPESVRRKSGQGTVELLIEVDERGHVESVEIVKSSGITRLDLSARNAYRRAIFSPSASGESATGIVTVTFRLRDN